MADLFKEVLPSIMQNDLVVITEENRHEYVPFVINKALSFHYDCAMYANQMNIYNMLDHKMQYDYLRNSVRKYKRPFSKWLKKEKVENLDVISEYYKYSNEKAQDALLLLSDAQINDIKKTLDKGGLNEHRKTDRGVPTKT
jgi:hypothetical protein